MKKRVASVAGVAVLGIALLLCAGMASGATVRVGTLVLQADGRFKPYALPKRTHAPIRLEGYGTIKTTDGTMPPALEHVKLDFDHDGLLTTTGLSVCQPASIKGSGTKQARQRCGDAMVGTGRVGATVAGLTRIELTSPLTLFNGPRRDGNPTVVLHAQAPFPVSETYVVVVPIERRRGLYGYRATVDVPPIAGGWGSLTHVSGKINRIYNFRGRKLSYVSARCSDYILQARGYFSFADGTVIYGEVFKACKPRP